MIVLAWVTDCNRKSRNYGELTLNLVFRCGKISKARQNGGNHDSEAVATHI